MRTIINRRAFLRTAASTAAVTAGVCTVTAATAVEEPDAALIALGARFDRVFPRLRANNAALSAAHKAFDATWPGKPWDKGYLEALTQAVGGIDRQHNRLYELTDAITRRIRETPAAGPAGLAVKVRALKHDLCLSCEPHPSDGTYSFDEDCFLHLIGEVKRMAQAGRS